MKRTFAVLAVILTLALSGCGSGGLGKMSMTKGEEFAVYAAREVEKVILNPGHMEIRKIYYREVANEGFQTLEEARLSVSGVSRGGAPVVTEFHVYRNGEGKGGTNHKFTDLEIFSAGADGAYMSVMNEVIFGAEEKELEESWEKIDAKKINDRFRD